MLAVLGGCVVILALIGLGFYAVGKMEPGWFRVRTSLLRLFSFSMEIGTSDTAAKSSGRKTKSRPIDIEAGELAPEEVGNFLSE